MLETVINYFSADPLKAFYLIGGSGGIWFWITQWRNRVRIQIKLVERVMDTHTTPNRVELVFEVENLGASPTSLGSEVRFTALDRNRAKIQARLQLKSIDRTLPPFTPKHFKGQIEVPASYVFSWYHTFKFTTARGRVNQIWYLNVSDRQIGFTRFVLGVVLFKCFGYVPDTRSA